jgi:hypothetical protein
MTKDEALKMCLEYIETDAHERKYVRHAIKEALAQPEHDYKDLYEKEKRKSAMWLSKYEEVAGPAPKAIPMAQPEPEYLAFMDTPHCKPLADEQIRAEFEAWHKDAYTQSLEHYGHTYKNHHTRCRWQGWLSAHGIKGEA